MLGENHDKPFPSVMQSFSSVPLSSLVEPNLKAKIWAKQFLEVEWLAAESTPPPKHCSCLMLRQVSQYLWEMGVLSSSILYLGFLEHEQ